MYVYYCKICGEIMYKRHDICPNCKISAIEVQSKYEKEHYEEEAYRICGNKLWWDYVLLEYEVICSPEFDKSKMSPVTSDLLESFENTLRDFKRRRTTHDTSWIPTYQSHPQNIPTCPTCGSTNLKKISDLNRAASVFAWGLASSKIGKQFECKNCGYKF